MKLKFFIGLGLAMFLSIPQVRTSLVDSMIGQMVMQIPLLALAGFLLGSSIRRRERSPYNDYGIPGLLIAIFASIFWLLPRSLDAALNSAFYETMKYITVPLFIGLPLARSWRRLAPTVKGFVWANLISMIFVMGWFYANSPIRLCNNYLKGQQTQLGMTLIVIAILLLLSFFIKAFFLGDKKNKC